jgi:hypothetical protein
LDFLELIGFSRVIFRSHLGPVGLIQSDLPGSVRPLAIMARLAQVAGARTFLSALALFILMLILILAACIGLIRSDSV